MADPRSPTRSELAQFLPSQRLIRAFEKLFEIVPDDIYAILEQIEIQAGTADARATQATDSIVRIADAIERLMLAPPIQKDTFLKGDYIDLPVNGPHVTLPRRIQWNEDDGTIDVGLYGGSVYQVGQETGYYAKNTSGAQIDNGTPVMFTGTVGASGKLTFGPAVSDGTYPPEYMMGVATQDIDNNAFGYVTHFGLVRGFDTTGTPYGETWADGDLLYFDAATPGSWTNVQPMAPAVKNPIAVVVNAGSGGSGSIFVRFAVNNGLGDLHDVQVTSVANNNMLVYVAANNRWENKIPADIRDALGLGSGTPTNGQLLIGNGTDFTTANLTAGSNVTITNGAGSITITVSGAPPTGAAGGVLSGTYPNPGFAVDMATQAELDAHTTDTLNPHSVTYSQVGADAAGSAAAVQTNLNTHTADTTNPHSVTKTQVGLSNVTNDAQLKIASNLADVSNAATARSNLGVAIGSDVQAYNANLTTWAGKTAPSGTVVGTTDTQTLDNKTLSTALIGNATAQIANSKAHIYNNSIGKWGLVSHGYDYAKATMLDASAGYVDFFYYNGTTASYAGYIYCSSGTTTYATSSDYRLKDNIKPIEGALDKIDLFKPCSWTWKIDGAYGEGFVAHELQEICPTAVVGKKDEMRIVQDLDDEGNIIDERLEPMYQGVDASQVVATAVAAIQELKAELFALKAEFEEYKSSHP